MHFDATDGAAARRDALHPTDGAALKTAGGLLAGKVGGAVGYEKACDFLATKLLSPLLRMGAGAVLEGLGEVSMLGTLYSEGIEGAHAEGDRQRELAASDAGVVGLAQALDFPDGFKGVVATAHGGSGNAAAAVRVQIDADSDVKSTLQFRADRGFVDAAGYAKLAAHAMTPLYEQATAKLTAARAATGDEAMRLRGAAQELLARAAQAEKRYLAPVMSKAQGDAAYGLGVQYALSEALKAERTGKPDSFEAAFAKAAGNARGYEPPTVTIGG